MSGLVKHHCYRAVASQALSTTCTTHTRHKTRPRLRSLTAAGGFASFYMLGLGEVSVAAVGWVYVGSGQRADSSTIQILLSRGNSIVLSAAAATITKHCNFNVFIPRALGGWTPPTRRRSQWSPLISITMARIQRHTSRQCRPQKSLHCRLHSHNTQQSRGSNVACLRMFPLPL